MDGFAVVKSQMMHLHGLSDSVGGIVEAPAECRRCGATTRLGNGLCLNCTLREGLDDDREDSRESFEAILAEDEVKDTHWRVGNYEILDEIGRGGMGVIYRARQRHSRRIVALKRMVSYHADSAKTRERFRREAEAAASLDHPNILPIYEVGQGEDGLPFFSMKYATGGSLQKAAPALRSEPRECVRLMAKVARAVRYAHEHGVLHRDLKPGNILLDARGEPFVTDFGLAKWLDTSTDLTRTLTIFGTPGYIAPEQAKGPSTDLTPAADVYSLGAVLFDLFTGRPPFLGEHALAVVQQASEKPAPKLRSLAPTLDRDLETICARCLERDPHARYRSAEELAVDLERWLEGRAIVARRVSPPVRAWRWSRRNPILAGAVGASLLLGLVVVGLLEEKFFANKLAPPGNSIAVLPFKTINAGEESHQGLGLADVLITRLSNIKQINVRPTSAVMSFENREDDPLSIGRHLRVDAILDGTIYRIGDKVRVTGRLMKVSDQAVLWSGQFEKFAKDELQLQNEIALQVVDALSLSLSRNEKNALAKRYTESLDAFQLYAKGRYHWNQRNHEGLAEAERLFRNAIEKDPNFALAYVGLADTTAFSIRQAEMYPALKRALELDPDLAEAYATQGFALALHQWKWKEAEESFRRSIELNPGYATAHQWYATLLGIEGRSEEAEAEMRRALEINPLSYNFLADLGQVYYLSRQYDKAKEYCNKALELYPDFVFAHTYLFQLYLQTGEYEAAIEQTLKGDLAFYDDANPPAEEKEKLFADGIKAYRDGGIRKYLDHRVRNLSKQVHNLNGLYWIAWSHAFLGNREEALNNLEKGLEVRAFWMAWVKADPVFDKLRSEPRYQAILEKMGL